MLRSSLSVMSWISSVVWDHFPFIVHLNCENKKVMDSSVESWENGVWQSLLPMWDTVRQWENSAKEHCHGAKNSGDLNPSSFSPLFKLFAVLHVSFRYKFHHHALFKICMFMHKKQPMINGGDISYTFNTNAHYCASELGWCWNL